MPQTLTGNKADFSDALMRAMQDGLIVRNQEGAIVDVNQAFCELTGFGRDELIGERPPNIFWPQDCRQELTAFVYEALEGRKGERDFTLVKNGGERIDVIISTAPLVDAEGNVKGVVSTIKDITWRKRNERELRQAAEFNQSVLASLAAHVCVVNAQGVIVSSNAAWQKFARDNGSPEGDYFHGRDYISICAGAIGSYAEEAPRVAAGICDVLEGRLEQFMLEYPCHSKDEQRWFLLIVTPLKGSSGGAVISHLNITDRKRVELDLAASLEKLKAGEESMRRHAAAMTRLARDLKRSNEELDQFAYVTSHDLKAPLRGIANLSRWIEEDLADRMTPEAHEQMNLLRGRVNRMENLIEGLLQYSRIGRTRAPVEQIGVGAMLRDVVDLLDPPEEMRIQWPAGLPVITGRRLALQQVFMNLISNAIKHHHTRKGRVEITCNDLETMCEFHIRDDGPGIPPEFHDKVFVIFQTLQPRDKVEGTGIGLAMVKKAVEREGGQVRIASGAGQGTTFSFTWPKVATDEDS